MNNMLKKGGTVCVHTKNNSTLSGIVLEANKNKLTLCHNFIGISCLDNTELLIKNCKAIKQVHVQEINSYNQILNLSQQL